MMSQVADPKLPVWLSATLAADALGGAGALPAAILPLRPGRRAVGYATTARIGEGDSSAIWEAIQRGPQTGTVLVAIGSPTDRRAVSGDIVAAWMEAAGFTAFVTDGLVRDSRELRRLGIEIWCRGVTPLASSRRAPGEVGATLEAGGVEIAPGDAVIADDDGVVVWPRARVEELIAAADNRRRRDDERLVRVRSGQAPD